uniref:DNA-directed RNA polymerase n=1 Tax=Pseudomuriella schumacherensis TaxID=889459 RepID=A0A140HB26_PSESB|nr:RNA polymerase beta subunit [Pseudomuriella schumacherensis]AMO01375.1 RNA polymerase beta subunit [Pseudomuriella schumacherensis]
MTRHRFFIPDLMEIQRQSFFSFLEKGIIEEISKRNPITNVEKDIEIFFYPEYYQLSMPHYTINQAMFQQKSYVSKLYIPVQLTDKKRKRIFLKWMLIAQLPLMTKRGNFVLNGSGLVIVNQLIRSPGIYFRENLHEIYLDKWNPKPDITLRRYYADLICLKGTWLRLSIEKDFSMWAKMKKGPKIPLLWLLIAMGFNERILFSVSQPTLESPNRLLVSFNKESEIRQKKLLKEETLDDTKQKQKYSYVSTPPEAWKKLSDLANLTKGKKNKNAAELGRKWLFKKFMNPRTYDLGKHGRVSLNRKLGLTISPYQTTLTALDLLAATNHLMKLEKGFYGIDDIDHLKNRRVRTSGELIQTQFGIGLLRLEKAIRSKLASSPTTPTLNYLINSKLVNGALKEFFGSNPLSQFMDQINPLAEITHKRRLSSLGPGGVARDTATLAVRGIHPSHYGRICPIETPEGKNTGLVNSLTTYARVNFVGLIETPFYKVYNGQVLKTNGFSYLSANQEEKMKIATPDLNLSPLGFLPTESIPGRVEKEFTTLFRKDIDYIGVSPVQMISVATSLIPFLEHDDANRALMGSNMQRQAVPLIRPQKPFVGTGLEGRAVSDSGHALIAKKSGYVTYSSGSKIIVYCLPNNLVK